MDFSWLDWTTKLVDLPKDNLNWWKVKEKIHRERNFREIEMVLIYSQ